MKKNYNIIHFITSLKTGGAENMLFKYIKYSELKYFSLIVCLGSEGKYSKYIRNENVDLIHLNLDKKISYQSLCLIIKIILKKPRTVIGWMYHGNLFTLISYFANLFLFAKPQIFWNIRQSIYNIDFEKKITKKIIYINKIFSFIPKKIIFNSRISMQQHIKIGFNKKNNIFIPNGFEINEYNISKSSNFFNKKIKFIKKNRKNIIISHIARLHDMKNHRLIFDTAKIISKKNDRIFFIFCGHGINFKNRNFRKKFNLNNNYCKNMIFLDEVKDVNQILSQSDIFVLSSSWGEGFPNIIAEAMINKCNVISTDVGDIKDIINNFGYTVAINDIKKLTFILEKLISSETIKKNFSAKRHIANNYNITKIANKFDKVFR